MSFPNTMIPTNEPIYCNLIDYDDFGLDSRLERLRVSASVNKNNNDDIVVTHNHQMSLSNRQPTQPPPSQLQQQPTTNTCVQKSQLISQVQQQLPPNQHLPPPSQQPSQPHQVQSQLVLQSTNQQTPQLIQQPQQVNQPPSAQPQPQQQPQPQSQQPQPQVPQYNHNSQKNTSVIHPYLQYLLSASSAPNPNHNQLNHIHHPIEDIDCYLNSPAKDFDIGDSSFNSRQLDSTLGSSNQRFQSYKYLTQIWPEESTSKMLDSPLGRKVYHVAAEQTKTLSPPKEKCVKNYGRVKSWGNSFDNLLNDSIGVKIYSRFLSREFSDENILFWLACEKFKKTIKKTEARKEAKAIYEQFLTINGSHTVNVDADARNSVAKNLKKPTKELFDIPQTQVYNLMKNDSYKRFLTSELYEMCLESEKTGKPLPVCSKDDSDKKKVPSSSSKRRLSLGSWVLKKTFRK